MLTLECRRRGKNSFLTKTQYSQASYTHVAYSQCLQKTQFNFRLFFFDNIAVDANSARSAHLCKTIRGHRIGLNSDNNE